MQDLEYGSGHVSSTPSSMGRESWPSWDLTLKQLPFVYTGVVIVQRKGIAAIPLQLVFFGGGGNPPSQDPHTLLLPLASHRGVEDVPNFLLRVPALHPPIDLHQEALVQSADLRDLVEDLPHQGRVSQAGGLGALERLKVDLIREIKEITTYANHQR